MDDRDLEGERMEFKLQILSTLSNILADQASQVVVDSTRVLTGEGGRVVMVSYHLEGQLRSQAQFTFPFVESVPLAESVEAFLDYGRRSWSTAQFAPSAAARSQGAAGD
jgi:hypothetical protein